MRKPRILQKDAKYHVTSKINRSEHIFKPDEIKNLFMAGRCFSCSHIGLGGPRVMNTTGQMGAANGYAASLCKKYGVNPREIYLHHLDELKMLIENSNNYNPVNLEQGK